MSSSIQRMLGGAGLSGLVLAVGVLVSAPAGHTEPVVVESSGAGAHGSSLATISHAVIRRAPFEVPPDQDGAR